VVKNWETESKSKSINLDPFSFGSAEMLFSISSSVIKARPVLCNSSESATNVTPGSTFIVLILEARSRMATVLTPKHVAISEYSWDKQSSRNFVIFVFPPSSFLAVLKFSFPVSADEITAPVIKHGNASKHTNRNILNYFFKTKQQIEKKNEKKL
jgi:hypothetical protein